MNKLTLSKNMLFFIIGAVVLLLLFAGLFIAGAPKQKKLVKLKKGDVTQMVIEGEKAKLTIKRNGLVEVETANQSFYQHWDEKRVARLFALLKNQDYAKYGNRLKSGESGYLVTISTTEGDMVIAITDVDDMPEGIDELVKILEEIEEAVDDDGEDEKEEKISFGSPTPTPSPGYFPSPTPTPTATPGYSAYPSATLTPTPEATTDPQKPFACDLTNLDSGINILSETVCNAIE